MKSLLGVILIGLAIFSHAEVWGADWKYLSAWGIQEEVKKNYPNLNDLAGTMICCDASSIVYPSRNVVKVWVRLYLVDREPISSSVSAEIKDLPVCKAMEVIKMPSVTKLYEIDCKERVYKTTKVYTESPKEGHYKEFKQNEKPELFVDGEILSDGEVSNVWKMLYK
jgi:hypothetical protein